MQQYSFALLYIVIGLAGAAGHYLKKRYVDNTTSQNFVDYLLENRQSTIHAIAVIASAEFALSMTHVIGFLSPSELVGSLTAGYSADSVLNRANSPDA